MPGARLREPRPPRPLERKIKAAVFQENKGKSTEAGLPLRRAPGGSTHPLWRLERGKVGSPVRAKYLPAPLGVPDAEACEGLEPRPLLLDAGLLE